MTIDSGYAQTLKDPATFKVVEDAPTKAAWGNLAIESEIISSLATATGATNEGARQMPFLKGPCVKDNALILGKRKDLIGKPIVGICDRLGYEGAGQAVFVVGAKENANNTTTLTVIRKL